MCPSCPSCGKSRLFVHDHASHSSWFSEKEEKVVKEAAGALSQIARWPDGAEAIVEAKALNHVLELLGSPSKEVQRMSCELVGHLTLHESIAPDILELKPCAQLVSLLRQVEILRFWTRS